MEQNINNDKQSEHDGSSQDSTRNGYGANATRVRDIPLRGWKIILLRVKDEVAKDRLGMVAAGVAFFGFLAVFPALAAIISIGGLIIEPDEIQRYISQLSSILPPAAASLLSAAAERISAKTSNSLGLGVVLSLLLMLWSANKGMKGLIQAIAIAYDEKKRARSFLTSNATSLALTGAAVLLVVLSFGLVVVMPLLLNFVGLGATTETILNLVRWPALAVFVMATLAGIYRVSPPRANPKWRWVTPGAIVAATLWLVGSAAFSYYTSNFGSYDEVYGPVAAVAILLIWFQMSAFVVLLGAEINCETERQTAQDTTTRASKPMGERDAAAADTVISPREQ